ncbi:jerky protein homolog-like [Leptopilina heterotoma]|uniref:jerky protein homolog-like n=1 Tax=Leptopilina heterotoma TaxID=63436 RepID=UPI001CA95825|nr:jerky protein homolog-like [Leptopilina heterotoma]
MQEKNLQLHQVYNADETALYWKMMPRVTFVSEFEKKAEGFKISKERITLMTCANADGSHKIPLFVIGKSKNPRCFKSVAKLPVEYNNQKSAWMTRELFRIWFTEAKFLPPNVTSLIQPMEQGVIEKLKKIYRKSLLRDMLIEKDEESLSKYLKDFNILNCCTFIAMAWREISPTNIIRAWRKLIPACDIDVLETNNVTEDDIVQLAYRLPGFKDITVANILYWLEMDNNEPCWRLENIEQILRRYSSCNEPLSNSEEENEEQNEDSECEKNEDTECEENEDGILEHKNIVEEANNALKCLSDFQKWYQRQWHYETENILVLQKLKTETKDVVAHLKNLFLLEENKEYVHPH